MSLLYEGVRHLIEFVYALCGDYGVAIVLITVVIRLLLVPLNGRARTAAQKQQEIGQRAQELQKKYKHDTQKMNAELEKLYQTEGVGGMGCLLSLIQLPIMAVLYNGIRLAVAANVTTALLPWVPSLLACDGSYILPLLTVLVQIFPSLLPYLTLFKKLNLPKAGVPMMITMLLANGWFACMIPAGIGLYYLASGLFTAVEQTVRYALEIRKMEMA